MSDICILSGLEIPKGKQNREHLVPKSRAPQRITCNPLNIFPAHKVINSIKSDLLPCEWDESKWDLCFRAVHNWHIKEDDKDFIRQAIINWEKCYQPNFCEICLLKCKQKQR